MTVPSTVNRSGPYSGNGVTVVFPYGFRILGATHLTVVRTTNGVDDVVNPSDYSVTNVGDAAGGNVIFTLAPAVGHAITIIRNAPFTQDTDLENQGAYYAETVEAALDLAAMRDQQLEERLDRAVQIPVGADPSTLPGLIEDVLRLSESAENIDIVANNIDAVNELGPHAEIITDNLADIHNFADVYQGPKVNDPVARNDGSTLLEGDLYFNTTTNFMRVYDGSAWREAAAQSLALIPNSFVGDGVGTTFVVSSDVAFPENILVWVGGVRQVPVADYTVSGSTVTLASAPGNSVPVDTLIINASDDLTVIAEQAVADAVAAKNAAEAAAAEAEADRIRAETAAETAEAIAEQVAFLVVDTVTTLKTVNPNVHNSVYLQQAGREGMFNFVPGDFTARVAGDSQEGVIIKANMIAANAGAWVRENYSRYNIQNFNTGAGAVTAIEVIGGGVLRVGGGVTPPTLPTAYTGTIIEYDGPVVDINFYNESGLEGRQSKRAWKMQHTGPHIGQSLSGFHIQSTATGSGRNGPGNADIGTSVSLVKKNKQSGAAYGEMDGQYIIVQQGGPAPTSRQNSSDWAGILVDSSGYGNCGHGFAIETALRNMDASGNVLYQVQSQVGGIETNWAAFNPDGSLNGTPLGTRYVFGFNAQMLTGQGDVAYLIEGANLWTSALRVGSLDSGSSFDLRATGEFWQGSGANRIKHKHNAGGVNITNSADVVFASMSPSSGIIAGDFNTADAARIQGGAPGTQTRLEAVGISTNINMQVLAKGTGHAMLGRATNSVGFYGSAGVVKQTGVAVTAAAIHAALVNLNLIAA